MTNILFISGLIAISSIATSVVNLDSIESKNIEVYSIEEKENFRFKDNLKAFFLGRHL